VSRLARTLLQDRGGFCSRFLLAMAYFQSFKISSARSNAHGSSRLPACAASFFNLVARRAGGDGHLGGRAGSCVPRWMPSVASGARRAAIFWANPTETMISAQFGGRLDAPSASTRPAPAGWTLVAPPMMPTAIGISSVPGQAAVRVPVPGGQACVMGPSGPRRSAPRLRWRAQSLPVAITTASHAVHDAFVVCGGAVGVHRRKRIRGNDPVAHLLAAEIIESQFL